jgi:hypothetical protein
MEPRNRAPVFGEADRQNAPEGPWRDLFDPLTRLRTVFRRHRLHSAGFLCIEDSFEYYERVYSLAEQDHLLERTNSQLAVVSAPPGDEVAIAESLYLPVNINLDLFVNRVLNTTASWNPDVTYGQMVKHSFVLFVYLKENSKMRENQAKKDKRHGFKASRWNVTMKNFVNNFVVLLLHCILKGPHYSDDDCQAVPDLYRRNNPLYQFVVVPILKMAKDFFPTEFDWTNKILKVTLAQFVKNSRDKLAKHGAYSVEFMQRQLTNGGARGTSFLQGMFLPHYRMLYTVSDQFGQDTCLFVDTEHDQWSLNCDANDRAVTRRGDPLVIYEPNIPCKYTVSRYVQANMNVTRGNRVGPGVEAVVPSRFIAPIYVTAYENTKEDTQK